MAMVKIKLDVSENYLLWAKFNNGEVLRNNVKAFIESYGVEYIEESKPLDVSAENTTTGYATQSTLINSEKLFIKTEKHKKSKYSVVLSFQRLGAETGIILHKIVDAINEHEAFGIVYMNMNKKGDKHNLSLDGHSIIKKNYQKKNNNKY